MSANYKCGDFRGGDGTTAILVDFISIFCRIHSWFEHLLLR